MQAADVVVCESQIRHEIAAVDFEVIFGTCTQKCQIITRHIEKNVGILPIDSPITFERDMSLGI